MLRFGEAFLAGYILVAILGGPASARAIYKWTDAGGRVYYSDRPTGKASQSMVIRPSSAPSPAAPASHEVNREKLLRAYDEERAIKKREAAERLAQKQLRIRNCAEAQQNLWRYQDTQYLYEEDGNGERRVLSFSERDAPT